MNITIHAKKKKNNPENIGYDILPTINAISSSELTPKHIKLRIMIIQSILKLPRKVVLIIPSLDLKPILGLTNKIILSTINDPYMVLKDINIRSCIKASRLLRSLGPHLS